MPSMGQNNLDQSRRFRSTLGRTSEVTSDRGRKFKTDMANRRGRSLSLDVSSMAKSEGCSDGDLPSGIAPVDIFIISRLNDSSSYFFTWFCKRYRIRIGVRDLGGKEEIQRCPICLDPCTKSIELQCGHAFCRSCLKTSAANNMTSCALCRREQVINPELLRARFDEQRMLNLAQRLAIPPPVRSRPCTSGSSVNTAGVRGKKEEQLEAWSTRNSESEQQEVSRGNVGATARPLNVESMTTRGHLLFGPWGDVGAMSADDLRRRWKFSSVQTSTAPGAATVGAASAAELRSSWRELQHLSRASAFIRSEREYLGTPLQVSHGTPTLANASSCSNDAKPRLGETCLAGLGRSDLNSARPDSPCAGGSSLGELSARWSTLTRVPPGSSLRDHGAFNESSLHRRSNTSAEVSVDETCAKERSVSAQLFIGDHLTRSKRAPPFGSNSAINDNDVGSLPNDCLRKRWHEAFKQGECGVGAMETRHLAMRLAVAKGYRGVGHLPCAQLQERWTVMCSGEVERKQAQQCPAPLVKDGESFGYLEGNGSETLGPADSDERANRSNSADEAVGAVSTSTLYNRWCAAGAMSDRVAPVG